MPDKPLPKSEAELVVFMENIALKLPDLQVTLGLTNADITAVAANAQNLTYLVNISQTVTDSKEAFFDFKREMLYGEIASTPSLPTFPTITTPATISGGIITWLKALLKRIKAAPGYTEQIGEELGLIVDNPQPLVPGDIVPELKIAALNDDQIEIKFSKQGLDALRVDWRPAASEDWMTAGVFTSSPGIYQHNSPGKNPQAIEIRGRLLQKNNPVSQYSPIYQVVTNP